MKRFKKIEVDLSKKKSLINPFLFGHNLEHTRNSIWKGLSAELISNRKFAGLPSNKGVAKEWKSFESSNCLFRLEPSGWGKLETEPYTEHYSNKGYDRRVAERQFQEIQNFSLEKCGIFQKGIVLEKNKDFQFFLAVKSDKPLEVFVKLGKSKELLKKKIGINSNWSEINFNFNSNNFDEVNLEIFFKGKGKLCVGAVSLLPKDSFYGMRRDVVELLKEIKVSILRWPGGNFVGSYIWKDGLLDVHKRAPVKMHYHRILPYTDNYDFHEIGIDEFILLCKEIGAEPFITINVGLENPNSAAELVEYCNGSFQSKWGKIRSKKGNKKPYQVRYWSIGNEMGYGHMNGPNSPKDYTQTAVNFAKEMKKMDNSIFIVASGKWWEEKWFGKLSFGKKGLIDCRAYHRYSPPLKYFEGRKGQKDFLRLSVGRPKEILKELLDARKILDKFGKGEYISFDEWNIWHTWYQNIGPIGGVFSASILNMLIKNSERLKIFISAYFELVNEGAIKVDETSSNLTFAGEVFSLFGNHAGNFFVEVGDVNDFVEPIISFSEKENKVFITIVNKHPNKNFPLEFSLSKEIKKILNTGLVSDNFLPGTIFNKKRKKITFKKNKFFVDLKKHSVSLFEIDLKKSK